MIKIIFIGKQQIDCPACKSRLEYENEDIISARGIDHDHPYAHHTSMWIICPVCERRIDVVKNMKAIYKRTKGGEQNERPDWQTKVD